MSDKAKRIIGWISLVWSAILLVGEILTIFTPIEKYANKTPMEHLTSLSIAIMAGVFGFHFIQRKNESSTIYHIIVFVLLVTPLFYLEIISKIEPIKIYNDTYSFILTFSLIASLIIVATPYLFGRRILKNQESRQSSSNVTPLQALHIIGLGCSSWPSLIGCLYIWFGAPKGGIYYFIGFSYMASAIWWAWWRYFYFKV